MRHIIRITFIGPTPENIRVGGDKAKARQMMKRRAFLLCLEATALLFSEELAMKVAKRIGFRDY